MHIRPSNLCRALAGMFAAVAACCITSASAATATITSVTMTGTEYVIDSDASNNNSGYTRDTIPVSVVVNLTGTPYTEPVRSYRVFFELFDEQGTEVALVSASSFSNVVSWPSAFGSFNGVPLPASVTFTGNLDPTTRLDPNTRYRVEAQVQFLNSVLRYENLGSSAFSSYRRFYHFTNTNPSDAERNVIARQTGAISWSRRFAITGSPDQQAFTITTPYELRRYDNYTAASATDPSQVQLVWDVKLFREAGVTDVEIPLLSDPGLTPSVTVPFYFGSTPRAPAVVNATATLQLRPASQLDSRNTHYAVVTLSHRELAAPAAPMVSNTLTSTTQRILHFNGRLDFGLIQTRIDSISGEPATGATLEAGSPAPSVLCSPQVTAGHLAAPYDGYTFGNGTALPVRLLPDGRAVFNDPVGSVAVTAPTSPDKDRDNGIAFIRSNTTLSTAGASAAVAVLPPSGMTITVNANDRIALPLIVVGTQPLDQNLRPLAATLSYSPGSPLFVAEETKPVQIETTAITWVRAEGRLDLTTTGNATYTQAGDMARLAAAPVPAEQKVKRSNERYYAAINGLLAPAASIRTVGNNYGAHLSASFSFGTGDFRGHFPHDARIQFISGQLTVEDDSIRLDPAASRLDGVNSIAVDYQQACLSAGCPSIVPRTGTFRLNLDGNRLLFTRDGGLLATGSFASLYPVGDRTNLLEWGYLDSAGGNPRFAHAHQNRFVNGTFHASGHFLQSGQSSHIPARRPGVVHLSGFHAADNSAAPERPLVVPSAGAYNDGNADYAGINLRAAAAGNPAINARSIVANTPTPVYQVKTRSKYYIRRSGVAGIHDAAQSPGSFVLYGFPVTFANFSFGFRETQNVSSATLGQITVPYPSDFTQPFEEMLLSCLGDLKEAKIPDNSGSKSLDYWAAEFQPFTMEFQKEDGCSPGGDAILAMTLETNVHHVPTPLQGKVGWYSDGSIVPKSDPNYSVTSRFTLPASLTIAGPAGETYPATPASEAYFNSYKDFPVPASAPPPGFVSFAVRVGVPYFEDLQVHCHTFAKPLQPPPGLPPSRLHLAGGWEAAGKTFFTSTLFDSGHRAYPPSAPNVNLATYRNEGADRLPAPTTDPATDPYRQYRVYAKRKFLNVVDFSYPIEFIPGARVWTSSAPQEDPLLVFKISHQIDRLSPKVADITFGASYSGIPALSLSNTAFSFVDEVAGGNPAAGGFKNILSSVIGAPASAALNGGLAALGEVTSDRFANFADPFIAAAIDPLIASTYDSLKTSYQSPAAVTTLLNTFDATLGTRIGSGALSTPEPTLLKAMRGQISDALDDAIDAIDVLADTGGLFDAGNSSQAKQLIKALVSQGSPEAGAIVAEIAGPLLDETIGELFERGAPSLGEIRTALQQVRAGLLQIKNSVNNSSGPFANALANIIDNAEPEVDTVVNAARAEIQSIVNNEANKYFKQLPRSSFETRIRARISSRLLSRGFTTQLTGVMRQYLYDIDAEVRSSIDSGFRVTNSIVRKVLSEAIEEAAAVYTDALGGLDSVLRGTDIDGYARITDDTLRTLRLDLKVDIDLMSKLKADFYLQIDCRQSNGDEACSWVDPGKYFTEVQMGANNVEAEWLGDMRLNVGLKFTLNDTGGLLGMGGSIELAGGKAKFEKFGLTDFGATAMFGKEENYVGARAKAEFNKKAIRVGFFFGRTCDIEPLKLVDKDVASILGNPPFTGGYVYGEMTYPLNEILGIPSTCFLSLTGTIGAGIWVFIEGPEYGGKMYMKIVGEVICVAEIGGEITLLGGKSGNDYVLAGKGRLWVEVCILFCFEGEAGVRVKCRNSDCDFDVDV
jgi:hypothetical protein